MTIFKKRYQQFSDEHLMKLIQGGDASAFNELYDRYHHRKFVHPDPLEFLYCYQDIRDREVVALLASALAYGRVAQILNSVSCLLEKLGPSPFGFLMHASLKALRSHLKDFKHRFTTGEDIADMLWGAKKMIIAHGSLGRCFAGGMKKHHDTVLPALSTFAKSLNGQSARRCKFLIPDPERGSACKRLHLFLRWMVRSDNIDPGGWHSVPASKLIVPVDTHMLRMGRHLKLTRRNQADLRTALDITYAFRKITPEDPVRYDFALTRLGIRNDTDSNFFQ